MLPLRNPQKKSNALWRNSDRIKGCNQVFVSGSLSRYSVVLLQLHRIHQQRKAHKR